MERNKERSGDIIIKVIKWTQNEIGREPRIGSHVTNEIKSNNDKKKIMKQFNLDEFKKNPARKVVTREGLPVRIVCTDAQMPLNIVALIEQGDYDVVQRYPDNGICPKIENRDLFFAEERREGFVNIYNRDNRYISGVTIHQTEEDAKRFIFPNSGYIKTIKIHWEE